MTSWLRDLTLLALLLGLLYGAFLGARPLTSPDEGRYAEIPREMVETGDYITPHLNYVKYFEKPALFYWLQAASIKMFGLNEWALRLVTALMGVLGCLITYAAARNLYGRRAGWMAALILATSFLYFAMSHFITIDITLSVLLAASLFSFLLGTRASPGQRRNYFMWAMYALAALATLTKGLIGTILPGAVIFTWILLGNHWRDLKTYCLPTGILLWLVITLPWHILVQLHNPEFFDFYVLKQQFARYLTDYADRAKPIWYLPFFLLGGLLPWTTYIWQAVREYWPSWRLRQSQPIEWFLLLWAGLIYAFFQLSKSQLPPYILPVFFPLAVLAGRLLASAWDKNQRQLMHTLGFGLSILICFGLSIAAIVMLIHPPIPIFLPQKMYFMALVAIIAPLSGLAISIAYWRSGFRAALVTQFISISVLLISLQAAYTPLDPKSIKSLMPTLLPLLKPDTEVASFHLYYQDLPVYIQRRVTIVSWKGELEFGIANQDTHDWIINNQILWQRWHSGKRMFMIMRWRDYQKALASGQGPLYILAQSPRDVLVTNQSSD